MGCDQLNLTQNYENQFLFQILWKCGFDIDSVLRIYPLELEFIS